MPRRIEGIVLIQLRPDLLAGTVADAIRRAGDLLLLEPAPTGPDMLDRLSDDLSLEPLVVIVGRRPSLEERAQALAHTRPDLVVVSMPIGEARAGIDIPDPTLSEVIGLLRWLVSGQTASTLPVVVPRRYTLLTEPRPALLPIAADGGPGKLVQNWLDAVLRVAIARTGTLDEGSLPGLTVSLSAAHRLLARQNLGDEDELVALEAERDAATSRLAEAMAAGHDEIRLSHLVRVLGLQAVEWQSLLLLLAPELDPVYQRVYGVLQDDLGRRSATLGLVGTVLGRPSAHDAHLRRELAEGGALARWWLTDPRLTPGVAAADPLQVDPAIRAWLIEGGDQPDDPRLVGWSRNRRWSGSDTVRDLPETERLVAALRQDAGWTILTGGYVEDWRAVIEAAAQLSSRQLLRITPDRGALDSLHAEEIATRIVRAAWLFNLIPSLAPNGNAENTSFAAVLGHLANADLPGPAILLAPNGAAAGLLAGTANVVLPFRQISTDMRIALLHNEAHRAGFELETETGAQIAASSHLPAALIPDAMALARARAAFRPDGQPSREVAGASRQIATPDLPRHARPVVPVFELDQVILPADRHVQLHEIVTQCRHAGTVLDRWGFGAQLPAGRAVTALFWGPSGTGKTMAAQAIAKAIETDLYVVDLARVVSKYIGETEKNLDAVFDEAERAGVVLLFDEADALFAKRGEVRDAQDRYANIEVAYLLQRLESFAGLTILTSNFRQNIDTAFLRRIRFAIEFPRPDAQAREKIWRQCLPDSAPVAADVDLGALARRVELTGGHIRQVTLRAAYAAADAGGSITMQQLLTAARAELVKIGMPAAANALPRAPVNVNAV